MAITIICDNCSVLIPRTAFNKKNHIHTFVSLREGTFFFKPLCISTVPTPLSYQNSLTLLFKVIISPDLFCDFDTFSPDYSRAKDIFLPDLQINILCNFSQKHRTQSCTTLVC